MKIRQLFAVAFAVALSGAAVTTTAETRTRPAPPVSCAAATTLDLFSRCALPDRKVAYAKLPLVVRRDLWRSHLGSFLSTSSQLSTRQRERLQFFASRLDLYVVAAKDTAAARSAMKRDGLTPRELKAVFGDSLARAMFAILGPDERVDGHTVGEAPRVAENGLRKATPYCNCSVVSDWCCHGECKAGNCIVVENECGTLWTFQCNGTCGPVQ